MSWLTDSDDEGDWAEYDESDARVRPNPKGNKPRSKRRPDHSDAVPGRVFSVDRGRYGVWVGEGTAEERQLVATRARELGRKAIVTGDRVDLVGDTSGDEGSLARVVRIQPRTTLLRRSADDTDAVERVIVANADQMLIVVAAANPEPRPRLVDRYLVAAYDAGIHPILCVTKTDLADPAEFLANFAGLDLTIVTSRSDDVPVDELRQLLEGHTTVAVGHSGVGKSTLVNALVPDANRATGRVNDVTGRGRHTSSSTVSYRLGSGWIVDTPGVRSFGLGHVDPASILASFTDLAALAEDCPRGCTHLPDAPDCAIIEAVERGDLGEAGRERLDSFQRLIATLGS
ncbi:ribosome biogenesis GTPase [Microbacteriaceae bacterium SG_E_30_P1]|uniref:Small ribosomal subunit biogenesis GTPase RsgA n=1 Tax=Antiquaquibacter oligotrophicus TaxID=2880260 RepID=A0ABT6KL52_9MICO|nr:ribosome small subunit-dependent GTPase A [Antiquaquibacter oligotrophicus]MDH6180491.1 ribosome biogenesis GTPase [Antiquaquibacter oligotrophicus]UDF13773.1 ribosome small subunit-dependent GTPase A [Antiquaquibacter oligotrophicus]